MKKILVIEDQPQMRKNLTTILEMENFQVTSVDNGRTGVELTRSIAPDLILCDVMMSELDGFGVLQALRANPLAATVPLIFLTAKGDKLDQRTGMNLGANDYLTKPASREDLLAAIQTRLAAREAHQAEIATARGFKPDFSSSTRLASLGLT